MPTYTQNLRATKPDTGSLVGSWGDVANQQIFDMMDEAFGFVSVSVPDSNTTLTISDGTTSDARGMCLVLTGTLTAGRTYTLGPNTVAKVWIVKNNTTGGFDTTISQGSGSNVVVPNGKSVMIYTDGAGGTASVGTAIDHDTLSGFVANEHVDHSTVSISGTGALTGGGSITQSRNINFDLSLQATFLETVDGANDWLLIYDVDSAGANHKRIHPTQLGSDMGWGGLNIDGLTAGTPVATDTIPFYDVDLTANRKCTIEQLVDAAASLDATKLTGTVPNASLSGAYTGVTSIGGSFAVRVNGSGQFGVFNTTPVSQPLDLGALLLASTGNSAVDDELAKIETWINNLRTNVLRAIGLTA